MQVLTSVFVRHCTELLDGVTSYCHFNVSLFAVFSLENCTDPQIQASLEKVESLSKGCELPVYCMCRRGIDSRSAVALLLKVGFSNVKDVRGGLTEWAKVVDVEFPTY